MRSDNSYVGVCSTQGCPDSIRSRVGKTEFGERFLESIPVLQWAKHVTPEQHRRLSHYPGAHGWGGIDYDSEILILSKNFPFISLIAPFELSSFL